MTQGERVKEVRKSENINMTLEKFGEKLGVTKQTVSRIENGVNNLTEQMIKSICREFNVDYIWLTTGNGEMFRQTTPEDEVLVYVSQLIDEKDNPFFNIILETMHTYNQLNPENRKIISSYCKELLQNLQSKKES